MLNTSVAAHTDLNTTSVKQNRHAELVSASSIFSPTFVLIQKFQKIKEEKNSHWRHTEVYLFISH